MSASTGGPGQGVVMNPPHCPPAREDSTQRAHRRRADRPKATHRSAPGRRVTLQAGFPRSGSLPVDLFELQRTVGNAAVAKTLTASPPDVRAIQRKTVKVAGGTFADDTIGDGYKAVNEKDDGLRGKMVITGAQMELEFLPHKELEAEEVSLVQTTNSTVENLDEEIPDQPQSMLKERRTAAGSAVDQELYVKTEKPHWASADLKVIFAAQRGKSQAPATNELIKNCFNFFDTGRGKGNTAPARFGAWSATSLSTKLKNAAGSEPAATVKNALWRATEVIANQSREVNLDPRYHEERTSVEQFMVSPKPRDDASGSTGWAALKVNGAWRSGAALRDRPSHTRPEGQRLVGGEHFEVAAMADGRKFLGSVRWGWKIANECSVLDPAQIELVSKASASEDLFEAAEKWNAMRIPDPVTKGKSYTPIQLPTLPRPESAEDRVDKGGRGRSVGSGPETVKAEPLELDQDTLRWRLLDSLIAVSGGERKSLVMILGSISRAHRLVLRAGYQDDIDLGLFYDGRVPEGIQKKAIQVMDEFERFELERARLEPHITARRYWDGGPPPGSVF